MTSTRRAAHGEGRQSIVTRALSYIGKVLGSTRGLKVLLCDEELKNALSIVYTQRELLSHEVILVEQLSNMTRQRMRYLQCIIFCRPTSRALDDISHEVSTGNYCSYHIFFTTAVSKDYLQSLANADRQCLIHRVEEVFFDITPLTGNLAVVPLSQPSLNPIRLQQWDNSSFVRVVDGLVSTMLMMNRRPVIRYRAGSAVCERLGHDLASRMKVVDSDFSDLRDKDAVVVILDRMDDPCTPLLMQWTYEAMIHELLGFQDGNKILLKEDGELNTVEDSVHVLSREQDSFFAECQYSDWGTLVQRVQALVKEYKEQNNIDRTSATLEEIKSFLSKFPEAKKRSLLTTRHTLIASRLSDEVKARNLYRLSEVEQQIVESDAVTAHSRAVLDLVKSSETDLDDALRLSLIYALRYEQEKSNVVAELKAELQRRGMPEGKVHLLDTIVALGGATVRKHQLFKPKVDNLLRGIVQLVPGYNGEVRNVFTMHQPLLQKIVTRLYNGSLREDHYPVAHCTGFSTTAAACSTMSREIIVFIAGGATFEEAKLVFELNAGTVANNLERGGLVEVLKSSSVVGATEFVDAQVILCSTGVVNSAQFIQSLLN